MSASIVFGDIFRYNGKEYIFLAKTPEIIYAAQILNIQDTIQIERLYNKRISTGQDNRVKSMPIFCFVVLETEEFRERAAHLNNTGKDDFGLLIDKLSVSLKRSDLLRVKEEIVRDKSPIPQVLKDLVKDIPVD